MNEEWLIDGYNVLHALSSLQKTPRPSLSSRADLCSRLAGFAQARKQKMWMVLDGAGSAEELKVHQSPYFEAIYSGTISADQHIEKYLYQHKARTSFIVVTDDRAISEIARGSGARVLNNRSFLEMLKEAAIDSQQTINKEDVRSHGFHRPFDEKLKAKGL